MKQLITYTLIMGALLGINLFSVKPALSQELNRNVALRVHKAFELKQEEKLDEAIELLKGIDSSRAYDTAYVQRMLGILYWQNEQIDLSGVALQKALKEDGLPIELALETERMLADILLSQGKYSKAVDHYRKVLANNKRVNILDAGATSMVWYRVAQSYYQLQSWMDVLTSLDEYYQLNPQQDVNTLNMQLGAELQLQRWKSAIVTTKKLRVLEPQNATWWRQLSSLHLRIKQYPEALATLRQMLRKGFDLEESSYVLMAQLYAQQGAPELAAGIYAEYLKDVNDEKLLSVQARYWQLAKEWDKALAVWKQAVSIDSMQRWSYSQLLLQQKQYENALAELNKMNATQRVELAKTRAYYRLGNITAALSSAQAAHKLDANETTLSWVRYLSQLK